MKTFFYPLTALCFWLTILTVSCQDRNDSVENTEISELKGMVHIFGKKKYNAFSGTWQFKDEATWLLLTNGWAFKNPEVPVSEMDFEKLRSDKPDRWEQWKDNETFKDKTILPPSPKGARYDMSIVLYSVGGNPASSYVSKQRFTMSPDGNFVASVLSLQDALDGGTLISNSDTVSGKYAIDGHEISLTFEDGNTIKYIFATDGKSKMILGRNYYFNLAD